MSVLHKYCLQAEILLLVGVNGVAGAKEPVYQRKSEQTGKPEV